MMLTPLSQTKVRSTASHALREVIDGRYLVKLAETPGETETALRLRYDVFNVELGGQAPSPEAPRIEFDEFDARCRHLLVIDRATSKTVGTYRLNSIESAMTVKGFYSNGEFSLEDLPADIVNNGVEIGRACIAQEHRNTRVLFLLWRGLASYLQSEGKRYFFGCCSIFTDDVSAGTLAYRQLAAGGHLHDRLHVTPRRNGINVLDARLGTVELPNLFNMYLRMGAKVCGPPTVDRDFGTIDFFVVCDTHQITEKYRRMFFSGQTKN